MLRLGPTAIVLGESDLRDYSTREARRKAEAPLKFLSLSSDGTHDASGLKDAQNNQPSRDLSDLKQASRKVSAANDAENQESPKSPESLGSSRSTSSSGGSISGELDFVNVTLDRSISPGRSFSPIENESQTFQSSPVKGDDFHYGGLTESPSHHSTESSSFSRRPCSQDTYTTQTDPLIPAPGDASTSPNLQPFEQRDPRLRAPLPRSPLYLSQNVSQSPEHRSTSEFTPRVVSQVATHNSPIIILPAPPRRPSHIHPTFRHQTNSFSVDGSERSSAAYDQERTGSRSTNESTPRPSTDLNLNDEGHGGSLRGFVKPSNRLNLAIPTRGSSDTMQSSRNSIDPKREFIFSSPALPLSDEETEEEDEYETGSEAESPKLPLPPPFSAVSRDVSNSNLLPQVKCDAPNLQASPVNAPSSPMSQTGNSLEQSIEDDNSKHEAGGDFEDTGSSSSRPISNPPGITHHPESNYNSRSPKPRDSSTFVTSVSPRASSTPRGTNMPSSHTQTPREYQVYNDDLSPDSQPQTPAHLPESRHRSRYHSSFTAPTNRHSRRWRHWLTNNHDGAGADLSEARIETVLATPSRRTRGGRSGSPTGMQSEGFQGLYGGRENGDDEQSWVDGVRVDNAEARLFSPAAIGNDNERSLDDTPEREDWRSHLR